jgi:hypothetical protein
MKPRSIIINISIVLALILTALPLSTILPVLAGDVVNLLSNGDFEEGIAGWEGINEHHLTTVTVFSEDYALKITEDQEAISEWIHVIPGRMYELTVWYRWDALSGSKWGYDRILVSEYDHRQLALERDLHKERERGVWHEIGLSFIPETSFVRLNLGLFGPQQNVLIYFDGIVLNEANVDAGTQTPFATETVTVEEETLPKVTKTELPEQEPSPVITETDSPEGEPTSVIIETETPGVEPTPVVIETATPGIEPTPVVTQTAAPGIDPTSNPTDATPEPEHVINLMINGGFEDGNFGWEQLSPTQLIEGDVFDGRLTAQILSAQEAHQGWLQVSPGVLYQLTAWVKWIEFEGNDWGYSRIRVNDYSWGKVAEVNNLHRHAVKNEWTQIKLEFTPTTDLISISFGMFGPQDRAKLLFDNFVLNVMPVEPDEDPPVSSLSFQITSPTNSGVYETDAATVVISGAAHAADSIVWDNIDTDVAGIVSAIAPIDKWQTNTIDLKPGRNEILFTAINAAGEPETARIVVHRKNSGPSIFNVEVPASQVNVYEKVEVGFQLSTVAQNYFYTYDTNPPPGVNPGIGVTAEGVFTTPSGETLIQPAFFTIDAERTGSSGLGHFQQTSKNYWAVRFSPREEGQYQVSIRVQDASGTQEVAAGSFTAGKPGRPGFIQVSKDDSRYFEFSNGQLFWPNGPADGPDYSSYRDTGMNMHRQWLAGLGAYSSNFARWISSAKTLGNEGFDSQLSFAERYPGHDLSQEIFYPEGRRFWIGWLNGAPYAPKLKPDTTYQIKARIKTRDLSNAVDPSVPSGFMVKTGGWPSDTLEKDLRVKQHLIPPISQNSDWFTVVVQTKTNNSNPGQYLYLYLDNVSSGKVYIDQFSIREVVGDGTLGGELIVNSKADLHAYVEPAAAAAVDYQVSQAEANGVYLKYVVFDKRDWIPNQLTAGGVFADKGDGFYQADDTRAMWLQKQWWRYMAARWGYSTAVHSWELNNEGSPDDGRHYEMAQRFAQYMHSVDSHPHLVTTSFWCCWRPDFWKDQQKYPDIDYADLHEYISDQESAYDVAKWSINSSLSMFASNVGKPIMWGESGIGWPGNEFFGLLEKPNDGDWYHDLLWSQLNRGAVSNPNYWWSQHLKQIDARTISKAFHIFVKDLDLNHGGYSDALPEIDNSSITAVGQKNLIKDKAHLWIHNQNHTWRNLMDVDGDHAPTGQSTTIRIQMNPNVRYQIQWWDTSSGVITRTDTVISDNSGFVAIKVSDLKSDVAVKMQK